MFTWQTRRASVALLVAAVFLAVVASARAGVGAYNEPAFTKTSANNTYWFAWTAITGLNQNGTNNYTYYLCLSTYHNGVQEEFSSGINGPGTTNCTSTLRTSGSVTNGWQGFAPYFEGTVLQDGHRYDMCATDFRWNVVLWQFGGSVCVGSTIDRNKPTLTVTLADGAALTNDPTVPVAITYSDPTSPPFNGSNGYASNWVCVQSGGPCTPGGSPNTQCSTPVAGFGSRINGFACWFNVTGNDGPYTFCTYGADTAVPDNPNGTDQFVNATSNNANLSAVVCDGVILDRQGPSVTATANATTVTTGQLVTFNAAASDPNGVSGPTTW